MPQSETGSPTGWRPGPPPQPGLYLIVLPDGRTGRPQEPMLTRICEWMHVNTAILWHFPVPDPPSPAGDADDGR